MLYQQNACHISMRACAQEPMFLKKKTMSIVIGCTSTPSTSEVETGGFLGLPRQPLNPGDQQVDIQHPKNSMIVNSGPERQASMCA